MFAQMLVRAHRYSPASPFQKQLKCFDGLYNASERPSVEPDYLEEALTHPFGLRRAFESLDFDRAVIDLTTKKFEGEKKALFTLLAFSQCFTTTAFSWHDYRKYPPTFSRVNKAFANLLHFYMEYKCSLSNTQFTFVTGRPCGWPAQG